MKKKIFLWFLLLVSKYALIGQTNSIDIGSALQNSNTTTTFNAWSVVSEGSDMQAAVCMDDGSGQGNTTNPGGINPSGTRLFPLTPGVNSFAFTIAPYSSWASGTYLSCFNGNTIYTPHPAVIDGDINGRNYNISSCTMTIRRRFFICSNTYENINFSIGIDVDNYFNSLIVDADSTSPIILYNTGVFSASTVNSSKILSPGIHTIDIKCANGDWQGPIAGDPWYSYLSNDYQWNPFGVAITGSITSSNSVLLNSDPSNVSSITGSTNVCRQSSVTLSNATPGGVWSSSNTTVATVTQAGIITGISPGNTVISYTIGQANCARTATQNFTVTSCAASLTCNNWLSTPSISSYAEVGNLNITGDKITVEATFNRTTPYSGGFLYAGDLVSKHNTPADCNYLLRPNDAEITTSNGYFRATAACEIELNKTYHVALVYDGSTLKFYRNGFLMSQVAATGNLFQNTWKTRIGWFEPQSVNTNFIGYINEVRIWNVAKTQGEINTYMNTSLPNPTTQAGLAAYYTFDNLINKQGNILYNGTISGAASINATNPNCLLIIDSCNVITQPQFCTGSLGNPVVNIDFGNGAANPGPQLSTAVPGASTNYNFASYATGTPPAAAIDGDYALVNQVPVNSAWYTGATDHTGNANGYMAFFNAAPSPGEFYRQTVSNLCPGTTYEFAAWIANVINPSVLSGTILPNITFKILDPATQAVLGTYTTGDIPTSNSMTWGQYSFLFLLPATNSSVTLVLANNNIGGSAQPGNDLAIDDITFRPCGPLTSASFSNTTQVDSTAINSCSSVNIFGKITGSFNNPSYQWQMSSDGGITFTNITGATGLASLANNLNNGQYQFRLLSAEAGNINSTNCRFISNIIKLKVTGCNSVTATSTIINTYTPVLAFDQCNNKITVEDASTFNIGDTVLMIQMKGAEIDSSNTTAFGDITNYKNAGNYEFNYIKSKTGNIVELKNILLRQYDIPTGKVQLIRVPYYKSVRFTDTLTCLPWNGKSGGVLVFNVRDTLTLNNDINVSGMGFNGGRGQNFNTSTPNCNQNDFFYSLGNVFAAAKGESIAEISLQKQSGRGKIANGGGGGNDHNAGGGGGSNATNGGKGGNEFNLCVGGYLTNGGLPGASLTNYTANNKIYLGGGGGAGHANDPSSNPFTAAGGKGGGLVLITSGYLKSNSNKINSNGNDAAACAIGGNCNDGAGGGGAGGTVLLNIVNYLDNITIVANGGNGANTAGLSPTFKTGPGGGGSAGVVWFKQAANPTVATLTLQGGSNGGNTNAGNDPWGALPGSNGVTYNNLVLPITSTVFIKNIDSVKITDTLTACKIVSFKGNAFVQANAIQTWQWTFGDNTIAATQNAVHTYTTPGTYNVKLVVTDINGCKDSITKQVTINNCPLATSTIINTYTPVLVFDQCNNKITVEDASTFNIGDTVLMIQMKGAEIDSTNTASFGNIIAYNSAGNFEYNFVKTKSGNVIEFKYELLKQYDVPVGKVQLIRVPYFNTATITDTLTCLPWDGTKGGVVVLNAATSVVLNAPVDVSRKGFNGGQIGNGFNCGSTDWATTTGNGGSKGEGIANTIVNMEAGGAKSATGGGGSFSGNTGGGGGSNAGMGGLGGKEYNGCGTGQQSIGGEALNYAFGTKIFLGGGGGGGEQDNGLPILPGGKGAGIVIINAPSITTNNQKILANGEAITTVIRDEGGTGGGAGGSVLLYVNNYIGNLTVEAQGGEGSSNNNVTFAADCHGPGGGGGGGYLGVSSASLPAAISFVSAGGKAGKILNAVSACFNTTNGAKDGDAGLNLVNLTVPVGNSPFKTNIDSVKITADATSCSSFDFKGIAFVRSSPISQWQWTFGDNTSADAQDTAHTYNTTGTYNVKLVVTDINGCKDSTTTTVSTFGASADFYYKQDICNPFTVQFFGVSSASNIGNWEIGPAVFTGTNNPVYTFTAAGNYTVKYIITNGFCSDTITKIIPIAISPDNIILTPDTTICFNSTASLRTVASLGFCWSPVSFLNDPSLPNPVTATPQPITYFFTAAIEGINLITNPGFTLGNNSFTTQYTPVNTNTATGQYVVGANPQAWNAALSACVDHTSGNGNMLMVNSDAVTNANVWLQTVAVTPNTNYSFSTWLQSLSATIPAQITFSINGNDIDSIVTAGNTSCNWQQFYTTWNSGNNTSAILSVVNKNTQAQGCHFALDDISFAPVLIKIDSVHISIDTPIIKTIDDTASCRGTQIQLTTTGGATYQWQPTIGLNDSTIAKPIASPTDTITYYVTGTTIHNCSARDSVFVAIKPSPQVLKSADTSVCKNTPVQLTVSGGDSYQWRADSTLSSDTIPNPIATPIRNTTYYVQTTNAAFLCQSTDSIRVSIKSSSRFTISPDDTVCAKSNVLLSTTGGNIFSWQPANLLNNPAIANPVATPGVTTTFTVNIKDSVCGDTASLHTTIVAIPLPKIKATKSNDIDCFYLNAQLNVTGGNGPYTWAAVDAPIYLSSTTIPNPLAFPSRTKLYYVTGIDTNTQCMNTDSLLVLVYLSGNPVFWAPNAFSPNGDTKNDCYHVQPAPGKIKYFEMHIYNRWGNEVFKTENIDDCWDGTYKGQPQDPGNFVIYIRARNECKEDITKSNLLLIR